jgi:hypothetical protein
MAETALAERLVALCGRLPLALRIVAARIVDRPHRSIADQVAGLPAGDPLAVLTIDGEAVVSAAFRLSCDALTD